MINLIFREGNRHVDPVWETQPTLVESCKSVMESKVSRLSCPIHKHGARATLLVDVSHGNESWDVADYCCEKFCRTISDKMPYPRKSSYRQTVGKAA